MVSVCHVISQDHVTKGLTNYGWKLLKVSQYPTKFCGHRHCGGGDIVVLVCQVILQELVTKRSSNFVGGSRSRLVSILPSLVATGTVVVEI